MGNSSLIPLHFDDQAIRVSDQDGNPWFVAADVCQALGIKNSRRATANLEADEKGVTTLNTLGGPQEVAVLSEAGIYTLALRCQGAMTPGTAPYRFRKWVTGVALPALRRGQEPGVVHGIDRETMRAIGGMMKGIVAKALGETVPLMVQDELTSHRFQVVEGISALEAVELLGYGKGKRPRGLIQFVSRRLTRYHEDRGIPIRRSRHGLYKIKLFDEPATRAWIANGGRAEVVHHLMERKGQGVFKLVPQP